MVTNFKDEIERTSRIAESGVGHLHSPGGGGVPRWIDRRRFQVVLGLGAHDERDDRCVSTIATYARETMRRIDGVNAAIGETLTDEDIVGDSYVAVMSHLIDEVSHAVRLDVYIIHVISDFDAQREYDEYQRDVPRHDMRRVTPVAVARVIGLVRRALFDTDEHTIVSVGDWELEGEPGDH